MVVAVLGVGVKWKQNAPERNKKNRRRISEVLLSRERLLEKLNKVRTSLLDSLLRALIP